MAVSKNQPIKAICAVFLLSFCVIFISQADANLLDPTLIGRELQTFASDALGVDEMQVGSLPGTAKGALFRCYVKKAKEIFHDNSRSE